MAHSRSTDDPLLVEAQSVLQRASSDPRAAIDAAAPLLAAAVEQHNNAAEAVVLRARGLALAKLSHIDEALEALAAARDAAHRSADKQIEAEVAVTQAAALAWSGDTRRAQTVITFAVEHLQGMGLARALVQRASMQYRQGRFDEAIADQERALPILRAADDQGWLANLLMDRAIIRGFTGRTAHARRDLADARRLYQGMGRRADAAWALQNEAWLLAQLGDIPGALAAFDAAEAEFTDLGLSRAGLWADRCEALLAVHLASDAVALGRKAVAEARATGLEAGLAEAELRLAEAALYAAEFEQSEIAAESAIRRFTDQSRPNWATHASFVALQARVASGAADQTALPAAESIAGQLQQAGFGDEALRARLLAARLAMGNGQIDRAKAHLREASRARRSASIELRVKAWLAEALLRQAEGDQRGMDAAARAGLRAMEEAQSLLGSADARAHVASHAAELGALGLEAAWRSGNKDRIFRWIERTRAGALRFPRARPPDDAVLAAELAQLRAAEHDVRTAQLDGEPDGDVVRRAANLRASVRRRSLRRQGNQMRALKEPTLADVRRAQKAATLVEFGVRHGLLHAVVVRSRSSQVVECGSLSEITNELDALRFALGRLSQRRGTAASQEVARLTAAEAVRSLDRLLFPVAEEWSGAVVIVPPAALHPVPWALLPSLHGIPVSVAPSARVWLERMSRPQRRRRGAIVVNGPDLPGAASESRQIAAIHPNVNRFTARTSKVEAVLDALDGAQLAHIVAHGSFRSDNPLFSSLRLADGGLTVYDLERVDRMPPIMVLSACNSGLQAVRPGDETMGIVAALLAAGCRTVIASTGLVPDTARTAKTMVDFHRRLVAGEGPASALAAAQADAIASGRDGMASAPFVCFGAG